MAKVRSSFARSLEFRTSTEGAAVMGADSARAAVSGVTAREREEIPVATMVAGTFRDETADASGAEEAVADWFCARTRATGTLRQ
jgi:hypothetical protein